MSHLKINQEDTVRAALKSLADHDRSRESQTSARAIFAKRPKRQWNTGTTFGAFGLAAAASLVVLLMWPSVSVPPPRPPAAPQPAVKAGPVRLPEPMTVAVAEAKPEPPRPAKRVKRAAPKQAPREIVTDFFPLMDVPPPFERGQLLRVVVPVATMRTVGLPVSPERWSDRVQADVLVGEEGMARAIRFVSYEQ